MNEPQKLIKNLSLTTSRASAKAPTNESEYSPIYRVPNRRDKISNQIPSKDTSDAQAIAGLHIKYG